jgi:hypothetical protein
MVRGIYATALTRFLLDKGYVIVQPTQPIVDRFGIQKNDSPADVVVKNDVKDRNKLIIVGKSGAFERIFTELSELLHYSPRYRSELPQYSVVSVRIVGRNH